MEEKRQTVITELHKQLHEGQIDRRSFLRHLALLGLSVGAAQTLASCGPGAEVVEVEKEVTREVEVTKEVPVKEEVETVVTATPEPVEPEERTPKAGHMLVFDSYACSGCMMCAVECAEKWANELYPEEMKDTINLEFSRIRPMRFQYVDVVNTCTYCQLVAWAEGTEEFPCVEVCPEDAIVTVPEGEGKEGLYGMGYKWIDREKCLGLEACGRCLEVCEEQFGSGISFDPIEHIAQVCTRCGGLPACVDVCPEEGALQFVPVMRNGRYYAHQPDAYAELLYRKMFNVRRDI